MCASGGGIFCKNNPLRTSPEKTLIRKAFLWHFVPEKCLPIPLFFGGCGNRFCSGTRKVPAFILNLHQVHHSNPSMGVVPFDSSLDEGVEGEVATHADIFAWVGASAALANNDVACENVFAAVFFCSEAFTNTIMSVLTRTLTFILCHKKESC